MPGVSGSVADWVYVCPLDDLDAGRGRTCEVAGLRVAIFRVGESIIALSDRCPHEGGSLSEGWIEDGEVVCPLHHWRFKLSDGRCTTMRGQGVYRFLTEVRDHIVWVRV
jgi:NAD(P)H-dependent nitrite reductase small subunit